MIISHLKGKLANNLFQVACAMGTGYKYFILPNTGHWQHQAIYKYFPNIPIYQQELPIYNGEFYRIPLYSEPEFNYRPIPKSIPDVLGLRLDGFFQSEKYFKHKRNEIIELFNLDYKPIDYVSLHWRLTDYLNPLNGINPMPIEYYEEALKLFPDKKVMVFSDDITFCKRHLVGDRFEFSENKNEYEDLSMMASCIHGNIIANSSFSWWGAWLNQNPEKIVVSPHYTQWFSDTNPVKNPVDLIPENWVQIKY